jgi:hypothetical protein
MLVSITTIFVPDFWASSISFWTAVGLLAADVAVYATDGNARKTKASIRTRCFHNVVKAVVVILRSPFFVQ